MTRRNVEDIMIEGIHIWWRKQKTTLLVSLLGVYGFTGLLIWGLIH